MKSSEILQNRRGAQQVAQLAYCGACVCYFGRLLVLPLNIRLHLMNGKQLYLLHANIFSLLSLAVAVASLKECCISLRTTA